MSDAVKLEVLDAIENEILAVPQINTNETNPTSEPSLDTAVFPLTFMWDGEEETTWANRLEKEEFPLRIQVWAEGPDYPRVVENLRGLIKKRLYSSQPLKNLSAACREERSEKFYLEKDVRGGIEITYEVQYLTKAMDPLTQLNY